MRIMLFGFLTTPTPRVRDQVRLPEGRAARFAVKHFLIGRPHRPRPSAGTAYR